MSAPTTAGARSLISPFWLAIWGSLAMATGQGFGRFAYAVVLPDMQAHLGFNYTQMGSLNTANFLGYLLGAAGAPPLARRLGRKRTGVSGLLLVGVTMIATGLSDAYEWLFAWRLLSGLGGALVFVVLVNVIVDSFPPGRIGAYTGIVFGGTGTGITLSGLLLPLIILALPPDGWRWCWYAMGLLNLLVALVAQQLVHDPLRATAAGARGQLLRGLASFWREPLLVAVSVSYLLQGFGYVVNSTFFVAYLKHQGLDPGTAGLVWSLVGVAAMFAGVLWGGLGDRIGRKPALVGAQLVQILAVLLPVVWPSLVSYTLSALLFGSTFIGVATLITGIGRDRVGPELKVAIVGVLTVLFSLGQLVGPLTAGGLIDLTGAFTAAFLLSAGVLAVSCLIVLPFKPTPPPGRHPEGTRPERGGGPRRN